MGRLMGMLTFRVMAPLSPCLQLVMPPSLAAKYTALLLPPQVSQYVQAAGEMDKLAGVALKRIQHFYYKTDVVYTAMRKLALQRQAESAAAEAAAPADGPLDGELMDGEEAEGATGMQMWRAGRCLAAACWNNDWVCSDKCLSHLLALLDSNTHRGCHCRSCARISAELIVVKLPADFTIPESCAELVDLVRPANPLSPPLILLRSQRHRVVFVILFHATHLLQLARVVYAHGNDNQKGQALLCSVYFRCIRDDFYTARDMLLMSRIQEQTGQLDAKMQVIGVMDGAVRCGGGGAR